MEMKFPVFVRSKDSGEIIMCHSVYEMQYLFEKTDVENKEYDGWDVDGRPLTMTLQEPVWLRLSVDQRDERNQLASALSHYAKSVGSPLDPAVLTERKYQDAFEAIANAIDAKQASKGPIARLFGRRMKVR